VLKIQILTYHTSDLSTGVSLGPLRTAWLCHSSSTRYCFPASKEGSSNHTYDQLDERTCETELRSCDVSPKQYLRMLRHEVPSDGLNMVNKQVFTFQLNHKALEEVRCSLGLASRREHTPWVCGTGIQSTGSSSSCKTDSWGMTKRFSSAWIIFQPRGL
jgi:hypothetical protein